LNNAILEYIHALAGYLIALGVPEEYGMVGALGSIFLLVTVVVLIFVLGLLRISRKAKKPAEEVVAGAEQEKPGAPEEEEAPPIKAEQELIEKPVPTPEKVRVEPPTPQPEEPKEVLSLFERMRRGLAKTQSALVGRIDALLSSHKGADEEFLEELEEILISADFGMQTTMDLITAIEKGLAKKNAPRAEIVRAVLQEEIRRRLQLESSTLDMTKAHPYVIMVVGVNGVGKTTTIGKLARQLTNQGKKVILGAGDTFRAAAAQQLAIWGERSGVEVIRHDEGADPAAVAFDAAKAAVARKADVLILDTAGRLHTKVNLMEEMKKIRRVLAREIPEAPHETLLVLDATTGQNALVQARLFKEAVEVTGIALTKLDGTAKGGMVVAIGSELALPVRYVGIGEGVDDLRPFDPELFVEALFKKD